MEENVKLTCWPVLSDTAARSAITQEFKPVRHPGVDIAVPGRLKDVGPVVVAAARGVVHELYQAPNGRTVVLKHGTRIGQSWAPGSEWYTAYLHMRKPEDGAEWLSVGDEVLPGDALGAMGADPTDPEGVVHLHFQLGVGPSRTAVDPAPYLARLTPA